MNRKAIFPHRRWTIAAALLMLLSIVLPLGAAVRVQRPITYDGGRIYQWYLYGEDTYPHRGVDFSYSLGTDVYATTDGTVVDLYEDYDNGEGTGFGNFVLIRHNRRHWDRTTQQNAYVYSIYAHLSHNSVRPSVGQSVSTGTWIAEVDNTGHSTGNHLHLQICLHPQSDRTLSTLDSENTSRNPELWLQPFNYGGTNTGTVVGKVTDSNGYPVSNPRIHGLSKPLGSGGTNYEWSETYSDPALNPDDILAENWGTTDVYPGTYHLEAKYTNGTLYEDLGWHTVEAGKTTYVGLYPVYLPDIMENYYGWNSSIVVRNNSDSKTAQVNTTLFWEDGDARTQRTDYIAPRGTVVVDVDDFPGTCYYCRGPAIVVASQDVAVVVETKRTDIKALNTYSGIVPQGTTPDVGWGQTGSTIYVPWIRHNHFGKTTRLYIFNAGAETANVEITAYRQNGTSYSPVSSDIASYGQWSYRTENISAGTAGSAVIESTNGQPLAVLEAEEVHADWTNVAQLSNAYSSGGTTLYAPFVKYEEDPETHEVINFTHLRVQNLGAGGTITAYYWASQGECGSDTELTHYIFRWASKVFASQQLGQTCFKGSATVTGGTRPLTMFVNETTYRGSSGFLPANGTSTVVLPRVPWDCDDLRAAVRVQNIGTAGDWVRLSYYRPDGSYAGDYWKWVEVNESQSFWNTAPQGGVCYSAVAKSYYGRPIVAAVNLRYKWLNESYEQYTGNYNGFNR